MQSTRLQNRNLFTFHQLNKSDNSGMISQKLIDIPRWKKPMPKIQGIDSVKPVVSGINSIELESAYPKVAEIRTLSMEVKSVSESKNIPKIDTFVLKNNFYFEPKTKSVRYKLERWFSLNWFILSTILLLILSFSGVILLIFRS